MNYELIGKVFVSGICSILIAISVSILLEIGKTLINTISLIKFILKLPREKPITVKAVVITFFTHFKDLWLVNKGDVKFTHRNGSYWKWHDDWEINNDI